MGGGYLVNGAWPPKMVFGSVFSTPRMARKRGFGESTQISTNVKIYLKVQFSRRRRPEGDRLDGPAAWRSSGMVCYVKARWTKISFKHVSRVTQLLCWRLPPEACHFIIPYNSHLSNHPLTVQFKGIDSQQFPKETNHFHKLDKTRGRVIAQQREKHCSPVNSSMVCNTKRRDRMQVDQLLF